MKTTLAKADLLKQLDDARHARDVHELALSDVVADRVTWFGRGETRIGISRPTGAMGGLVIVRRNGMAYAAPWEQWSVDEARRIDQCITGADTDYNRELLRQREQLESARAFVAAAWEATR